MKERQGFLALTIGVHSVSYFHFWRRSFTLQTEIAVEVVSKLRLKLSGVDEQNLT